MLTLQLDIFYTRLTTDSMKYRWSEKIILTKKAEIILRYYQDEDPFKKKIAASFLESFYFIQDSIYQCIVNEEN